MPSYQSEIPLGVIMGIEAAVLAGLAALALLFFVFDDDDDPPIINDDDDPPSL